MERSRRGASLVLLACTAVGCQNDFTPPSEIHGLRVLAVRQDPASGSPGATVKLDMLLADGRRPMTAPDGTLVAPPTPEIEWVAGCNNPPSRAYYACEPALRALSQNAAAALGSGLVGSGTEFAVGLPDDVLSAAPKLPTDPVHYGVSFAFFAACGGNIVLGGAGAFPFGCQDDTGASVGSSGFVIGFTTIYSYDGAENQNTNPSLTGLDFDGTPALASSIDAFVDANGDALVPAACMSDDDCSDAPFSHPARCSDQHVCAPAVSACQGKGCAKYGILPHVDPASFEHFAGANEIIWASYYTTLGSFDRDTRLVVDRSSGPTRDFSAGWTPPAPDGTGLPRTSRIWVTLNDQRGGATWAYFDVVVE